MTAHIPNTYPVYAFDSFVRLTDNPKFPEYAGKVVRVKDLRDQGDCSYLIIEIGDEVTTILKEFVEPFTPRVGDVLKFKKESSVESRMGVGNGFKEGETGLFTIGEGFRFAVNNFNNFGHVSFSLDTHLRNANRNFRVSPENYEPVTDNAKPTTEGGFVWQTPNPKETIPVTTETVVETKAVPKFKVGDRVCFKSDAPLEARTSTCQDDGPNKGKKKIAIGRYYFDVSKVEGATVHGSPLGDYEYVVNQDFLELNPFGNCGGFHKWLDTMTEAELATFPRLTATPKFKVGDWVNVKPEVADEFRIFSAPSFEGRKFKVNGTYTFKIETVADGRVSAPVGAYHNSMVHFLEDHVELNPDILRKGTLDWVVKSTPTKFNSGDTLFIKEGTPEDVRTFAIKQDCGWRRVGERLRLFPGSAFTVKYHREGKVGLEAILTGHEIDEQYVEKEYTGSVTRKADLWLAPEAEKTASEVPPPQTVSPLKGQDVPEIVPQTPTPSRNMRTKTTTTAKKWEYKLLQLSGSSSEIEPAFNTLGNDGWELVKVSDSSFTAFFKRPLRSTNPPTSAKATVIDCPKEIFLRFKYGGWYKESIKEFVYEGFSIHCNVSTVNDLRSEGFAVFLNKEAADAAASERGGVTVKCDVDPKTGVITKTDFV